jgi:hypothetical protein
MHRKIISHFPYPFRSRVNTCRETHERDVSLGRYTNNGIPFQTFGFSRIALISSDMVLLTGVTGQEMHFFLPLLS